MELKRERSKKVTFIILNTKNINEEDKLVFLYTKEYGLLKVVAKSARKITSKFTGKLIQLSYGEAELYFGPQKIIITELKSKNLINDENNLKTIQYAQEIAKITKSLTHENQIHTNLIELIIKSVSELKKEKNQEIIFTGFVIKLLEITGLMPDLNETKSRIQKKYIQIFEKIKKEKFAEIIKINLSNEEENYIKLKTEEILEYLS